MEFFISLHQYNDLGLLILRIVLGTIFVVHGLSKWAMWKMQPSEKMPANMLNIMKLLSICEPLGGIAIISGFLTQLAALGLLIIMLGAINLKIKTWKVPFTTQTATGWEFDLILLASAATLILTGAGSLAIDRLLFGI